MNSYVLGTLIDLEGDFVDVLGNTPADPTAVTVKVIQPDDTEIDLSAGVERIGIGQYIVYFNPTMGGIHSYRFAGTGAVIAANEDVFSVTTAFPNG